MFRPVKTLRQQKRRTKVEFESAFRYIFTFIKWFTIALVTGLVGGTVGSLFHMAVNYATDFREEHTFVIYFLPLAGVLITLIYHYCGSDDDGGTNLIISSIRTKNHVPLRMAPLIFISTVITHLVGGSAGREGAALQLGGSIGNSIGELFKVRHEDIGIAVMCGMSALFSALFGTPLTACFFAMEVISVGVIYYVGLVPCIVSAFTAYKVSLFMGAEPTRFDVSQYIPEVTALTFLRTVAVAVICAFVSIVFCMAMKYVRQWFAQMTENRCIRAAAGGFFLLALTLILQTNDYNGAGMAVIERAVCEGKASTAAFLLKIVFTAITIGAGFKGGEIVPTMFIGATLGCVVSPYLGLSAQFGAAVGIAALFCSVVNCPIAAIFLSLELFGSDGIILYAAACGVSYMLSGYYGLYSSQKIVYSKLHTRYINRHTK